MAIHLAVFLVGAGALVITIGLLGLICLEDFTESTVPLIHVGAVMAFIGIVVLFLIRFLPL